MSKPMAICIEDLDSQSETSRYIRCVALAGRQPGLRLDEAGRVLWQSDDGVACELWVSADERLILYRPEGATRVTLHRAGRSLDVPCGKPVVVSDKDQINVGSRRLRIHVHGEAPSVAAPSPLPARPRPFDRVTQAVAAAAVIGAVATAESCVAPTIEVREAPPKETVVVVEPIPTSTPTIEVREAPPEKVITVVIPTATAKRVPTPTATVGVNSIMKVIQGEWTAAQAYDVEGERVWITGTLTIVGNRYTFKPVREVKGPSVQGHLDFLFDMPVGEVTIDYRNGVTPDAAFADFAPGEVLATCVLRANSVAKGEFLIRVGDSNSLHFTDPSGKVGLWSITKQPRADNKQ
jgi:hypothetical protein